MQIIDLPVVIFDECNPSPFYSEALGPTLNLQLHVGKNERGNFFAKGVAQSENLNSIH